MTSPRRGRLDPAVSRGRQLVAEHLDLAADRGVVIGLSGGADSLALVAAASHHARKGRSIRALVIDHGLQNGSADVCARAAEQSESLGVSAEVICVDVDLDSGAGIEAAARTARLAALEHHADGALILLAHTLDDQAETVLLGLGRGSGPRSIAGMRRFTGVVDRPFLPLRRSQTEQICRAHDLDWWNDPHNADSRFRRVRVRREALPVLEDVLGGGVAEALARTADLVRADADVLDALALKELPDATTIDDIMTFADLPTALRSRIWRRLAIASGASPGELSHTHTQALEGLLNARGGARIELPGGVSAERSGNRIHFVPTPVAR